MASLTCQRHMGASSRTAAARRSPVLRVVAQAAPAAPTASHAVPASKLIDGKGIADTIRSEIATEVADMKKQYGLTPGLAVVLVGARKDSETYVRSKKKACAEVRSRHGVGNDDVLGLGLGLGLILGLGIGWYHEVDMVSGGREWGRGWERRAALQPLQERTKKQIRGTHNRPC